LGLLALFFYLPAVDVEVPFSRQGIHLTESESFHHLPFLFLLKLFGGSSALGL